SKKPAVGAIVSIYARDAGHVGEMVDGDGRLFVRLADARDVTVRVSHPQLMSPREIHIPQLSAVSGRVIEMEMYRKVRISGRCVDADTGRPVPGIQVGLVSRGAGQYVGNYGYTDADGRYEIEAPEGPAVVDAISGADRREGRKVEADTAKTTRMPDLKLKLLP